MEALEPTRILIPLLLNYVFECRNQIETTKTVPNRLKFRAENMKK